MAYSRSRHGGYGRKSRYSSHRKHGRGGRSTRRLGSYTIARGGTRI